jgi:hypothetical protein
MRIRAGWNFQEGQAQANFRFAPKADKHGCGMNKNSAKAA